MLFFSLLLRRPPLSPLFPYTTLFRSIAARVPDDVLVLPAHRSPFRGLHARIHELIDSHRRGLERLEGARSEEHTSELISYAVFCLKKKIAGRIDDTAVCRC